MKPEYAIADTTSILSPGLLFYKELIRRNIERCLQIAGSPERLRPHVKTHKLPQVVRMQLAHGIQKFKCATIAEAEMLGDGGKLIRVWIEIKR